MGACARGVLFSHDGARAVRGICAAVPAVRVIAVSTRAAGEGPGGAGRRAGRVGAHASGVEVVAEEGVSREESLATGVAGARDAIAYRGSRKPRTAARTGEGRGAGRRGGRVGVFGIAIRVVRAICVVWGACVIAVPIRPTRVIVAVVRTLVGAAQLRAVAVGPVNGAVEVEEFGPGIAPGAVLSQFGFLVGVERIAIWVVRRGLGDRFEASRAAAERKCHLVRIGRVSRVHNCTEMKSLFKVGECLG